MRVILCIVLLALCQLAYSQEPPQAPRVESNEKSKDSPPANDNSKNNSQLLTPPPSIPLQSIPSIDTNKTSEDTNNGRDEASEFTIFLGHRIKFTDSFLVLFTFLLFVVTGLLWWSTRRLVKGAEDTAQRQLRAYVSIEHAQITGINNGETPTAQLTVKNSGQTPAYDLIGIGGIAMGVSWETLAPPDPQPFEVTQASLAPGAIVNQFNSAPRRLEPGEREALVNGSRTLWVYGEIRYRDTFNIERFIEYRFQIGGRVGIHDNFLAICQEGNRET